ncbi:allantoinase PuuE [Granulosicoccus antarcticus]|uniref:Uric acid degradation bifunctional protein n=1 Tax=Granulosicoccus antarcticus IMCC3135 TaxID=1192854 RepID=A0A2Z2NRN8_9GAMM|nr:allantoinase PuuE [Granulosicoccus antarcticus]ASJ74186.1 Uric acid degradation bifunctional protein [Granulosicoccus antarcticus IMCC3135]
MTDSQANTMFKESPAELSQSAFVQRFGDIYEHSAWVAERSWAQGVNASHNQVSALAALMADVLSQASEQEQMQLIRAHPDLAGKAALQGELTDDSTDEQSSAGLDQCTAEELAHFQQLNDAYKARFDIPFIMAVRHSNRHQILAGFEERLQNEPAAEFARALAEINRIALFRLQTQAEPLYPRDMIGYGNQPPKVTWPGKARIAVQFVINYEEGAENCVLHGDKASEAFLSEIVGAQALPGVRHMNMESIYEYGSRVGFWRLHKLFTERKLPVTVFGVAMALERNPEAVAAMLSADWEIASHGYRWIDYQYMDEAEEKAHMLKAIEIHTRVTGQRPTGWYLGRCSPNTHRLVAEEGGFAYNADSYADDVPYWDADFGDKPQLIVPYTLDANDMRFASPQGFNAGDQFFNYLKDSFDTLHTEGLDTPRMMSIGLHCRLVGRPGRIAALARFLDYVQSFDDAWVARRIDIAEHWQLHHPAGN